LKGKGDREDTGQSSYGGKFIKVVSAGPHTPPNWPKPASVAEGLFDRTVFSGSETVVSFEVALNIFICGHEKWFVPPELGDSSKKKIKDR